MGVVQGPEPTYVSWTDVIEHLRYYEQGYGRHLNVPLYQACPPGEQFPKLFIKLRLCDELGNDDPAFQPTVVKFPNQRWRTIPALLLHVLWEMDNELQGKLLWTEPLATKPRKGA